MGMQRLIIGLLAIGGLAVGCSEPTPFVCQDDRSCSGGGQCVSDYCAFEDRSCASTLRYGAHAAAGLSEQCVVGDESSQQDTDAGTFVGDEGAESSTGWWDGSSGETGSGTGSEVACIERSCEGCLDCATDEGEACESLDDQCFFEAGCYAAAFCIELCFDDAECVSGCCAEASPRAADLAVAVAMCAAETCAPAGCEPSTLSCASM